MPVHSADSHHSSVHTGEFCSARGGRSGAEYGVWHIMLARASIPLQRSSGTVFLCMARRVYMVRVRGTSAWYEGMVRGHDSAQCILHRKCIVSNTVNFSVGIWVEYFSDRDHLQSHWLGCYASFSQIVHIPQNCSLERCVAKITSSSRVHLVVMCVCVLCRVRETQSLVLVKNGAYLSVHRTCCDVMLGGACIQLLCSCGHVVCLLLVTGARRARAVQLFRLYGMHGHAAACCKTPGTACLHTSSTTWCRLVPMRL